MDARRRWPEAFWIVTAHPVLSTALAGNDLATFGASAFVGLGAIATVVFPVLMARRPHPLVPLALFRSQGLEVLETLPPSYLASTHLPDMVDDVRLLLTTSKPGQIRHRIDEGTQPGECALTLCIPDRPGALARARRRASAARGGSRATASGGGAPGTARACRGHRGSATAC